MKRLTLLLSSALLSLSVAHASDKYSSMVGVQAIARTVVAKKLVDAKAASVLKMALETGKAELGEMECDRALSKDVCVINVFVKDDETTSEAEETVYQLQVTLYQGTVTSARFNMIAG